MIFTNFQEQNPIVVGGLSGALHLEKATVFLTNTRTRARRNSIVG
jgi:hypothetical protein